MTLLGSTAEIAFIQSEGALEVTLPSEPNVSSLPYCLRVQGSMPLEAHG